MPAAVPQPLLFRSTLQHFPGVGAPHYFAVPEEVAAALGGKQGVRLQSVRLAVTVDAKFTDYLGLRRRSGVFFVSAGVAVRNRCRVDRRAGLQQCVGYGLEEWWHGRHGAAEPGFGGRHGGPAW